MSFRKVRQYASKRKGFDHLEESDGSTSSTSLEDENPECNVRKRLNISPPPPTPPPRRTKTQIRKQVRLKADGSRKRNAPLTPNSKKRRLLQLRHELAERRKSSDGRWIFKEYDSYKASGEKERDGDWVYVKNEPSSSYKQQDDSSSSSSYSSSSSSSSSSD